MNEKGCDKVCVQMFDMSASKSCKTRENSNFMKNGKMVISVKI